MCDVDNEWRRERTGREEGAVWAVCVQCAYEERKTDSETDGDDQCAADCTKAKNPWGHKYSVAMQDLLVLIGCAAGMAVV